MSGAEDSPGPRRSQRERKQASQYVRAGSAKRKRTNTATDDDGSELTDLESSDSGEEDPQEYAGPKPKAKAASKRKPKNPSPVKKVRKAAAASKDTDATSSAHPKRPRARKGKDVVTNGHFDSEKVARETKIASDNALFNAIMNPAAALQSTAEDFLDSLSRTPGPSLAELINCILRTCGCNDTLDADEVVDYDGVVDALDNFTEVLKQDDSPVYPLTSKLPVFKKFRKSLSEILERLIISSADLGLLYTSDLMATLQTWVIAMSSSQLRSFRHTATVIALEVETALCDVAAAVEKEAEVVARQREGERKRKAQGNKGGNTRDKELEAKAAEIRERRSKLSEFIKEFVNGVFVHRYRDLDPNIRAECVRAMGLWFKKYPGHFLDGAYLRYVGWVLSDAHTHVRLEAVRALALAYEQTSFTGGAALQHFTERFKPRLVQMAVGDTELTIRVAVVQVLRSIDSNGLLEDEQRERLCLLLFDEEARVRKAVSGFVKGVWQEGVDERLVGKKVSSKEKEYAGIKTIGSLLVKWGRALDKTATDDDSDDDDEEHALGEGSKRARAREMASLLGSHERGRTALAVEALWDEVDPIRDWRTLLDMLLLDHSAPDEAVSSQGRKGRSKGRRAADDGAIDEAWRLEEVEEAVLLEMLVASLRKAKADVVGAKKGEDEALSSDITRDLIKGLPRLFMKYQTIDNRVADVLLIVQLMNLDMYLEMRMMTAYESLWDDIIKQFLSHSTPIVLTNAVNAIRHMMNATSLSNTNSTKILELEDEMSTSLRDAIAGREELEVATFTEDEVLRLGAICARLAALAGIRDMTTWMEEDEGGKQSSAWDIVSALVERGRLGYKEEEMMVDRALQLLTLHIIWKARGLNVADSEGMAEETPVIVSLRTQRESLLEKLLEYAVGTQSNTADGVRRAAFQNLMHLHILFSATDSPDLNGVTTATARLHLVLDDEVQYRCAGFIQAEVERYAEELDQTMPTDVRQSDAEGSDTENEHSHDDGAPKGDRNGRRKRAINDVAKSSRLQLEKEYIFMGVVTTFLRAIRAGVIHFQHSAVLLTHYGRLGPAFDLCSKVIVDILREEGMYKDNGEAVVKVICQALRESFTLFLDGVVPSDEHTLALAKALSSCFVIRGAQLSIVRRLDSQYVVGTHTYLITWICKRIAAYENAKNKKSRNQAIQFFKVLLSLLNSVEKKDSLQIKAHLDQVLAQSKLEVSPAAKPWEPCRNYEKRLSSATLKEKGTKAKKSKKAAKSSEMVTTDDDLEGPEETETEEEGFTQLRPKPKAAYRSARTPDHDVDEAADTGHEPSAAQNGTADPTTPRAQSRSKPTYRQKSPFASPAPSESRRLSSIEPDAHTQDGLLTLSESRKRGRSQDIEDSEDEQGAAAVLASLARDASHSPSAIPSPSQGDGEIQIRRKRVRH